MNKFYIFDNYLFILHIINWNLLQLKKKKKMKSEDSLQDESIIIQFN